VKITTIQTFFTPLHLPYSNQSYSRNPMFCRSPVITTCSQVTGEYSDLQVLRVTVNTGTGHAVSRSTTVKGWCCSSRECCEGREQKILCRKNSACYKVSDSASEKRRVLEKVQQRNGGEGGVGSRESTFWNTNWSTSLSLCLWRNAAPHFKWFNQYKTGVYKEQDRSYRL
jgi:hypothetical protein